jgi:hypothetical protein
MRSTLASPAVLIAGVAGVFASWLVVQALTDAMLGPGHSPFDAALLVQPLLLAPIVLPPLLIAGALQGRGRTNWVALFLLGWGCLWPIVLVYWVVGAANASLSGGIAPSISLISGPGPIIVAVYFAVLPLAGLWLISAGSRLRRVDSSVSQS